jgi:uncharacterized protein (DUF1015 family)
MLTIGAQTGPVFLTYRGTNEINSLVESTQASEPLYDFTAADGIVHTLWRVPDELTGELVDRFRSIALLYIADGHHRAASAARARDQRRAANPGHTGDEEYNFFLSVLFPADQVRILAYNRVVRDLNAMSSDEFKAAVSRRFAVAETLDTSPKQKGEMCMYLAGRWYSLKLPPGTTNPIDPIKSLDVTTLQERVLDRLLGIKDVRTDKRIDFVGGIRGASALEKIVDEGRAAVAFSMYPVSVDQLIAVADAGEIMPPKSTWFEPKLRDGLLSHLI